MKEKKDMFEVIKDKAFATYYQNRFFREKSRVISALATLDILLGTRVAARVYREKINVFRPKRILGFLDWAKEPAIQKWIEEAYKWATAHKIGKAPFPMGHRSYQEGDHFFIKQDEVWSWIGYERDVAGANSEYWYFQTKDDAKVFLKRYLHNGDFVPPRPEEAISGYHNVVKEGIWEVDDDDLITVHRFLTESEWKKLKAGEPLRASGRRHNYNHSRYDGREVFLFRGKVEEGMNLNWANEGYVKTRVVIEVIVPRYKYHETSGNYYHSDSYREEGTTVEIRPEMVTKVGFLNEGGDGFCSIETPHL